MVVAKALEVADFVLFYLLHPVDKEVIDYILSTFGRILALFVGEDFILKFAFLFSRTLFDGL